ncbi:hypothetical protein ABZ890_08390 [Streptomyces sp. NPDC046984]|uniref:hypothetical protein n=1 Tax=Streptomyces sp. NPDC046984 TaxID=3155138 RepID=UPI0033F58E6A
MTFAPRTWVVGEVVSAAIMNQEIRDQLNSIFGTWTTYTPSWTASTTNPTIGNGTITGRYLKVGRTVFCEIFIVIGSSTTLGSGTYLLTVPFPKVSSGTDAVGASRLSAGSVYLGQCVLGSNSSTMNVTFPHQSTPGIGQNWTNTTPVTLASTHVMRMSIAYEASS